LTLTVATCFAGQGLANVTDQLGNSAEMGVNGRAWGLNVQLTLAQGTELDGSDFVTLAAERLNWRSGLKVNFASRRALPCQAILPAPLGDSGSVVPGGWWALGHFTLVLGQNPFLSVSKLSRAGEERAPRYLVFVTSHFAHTCTDDGHSFHSVSHILMACHVQ
jgi:hypothetical protein